MAGGRAPDRVTVVGAGVSGLATAWYLTERQVRVHVIDAGARPGGLIQTQHMPEGMIEAAARAFTWTDRAGSLFEAAGVPPVFARPESRRRYIFRDGRPQRWPLTLFESAGAAARFGRAWIGRRTRPRAGETVADWGARVIGPAATEWLLAPALQGIYASPPAELSAPALFGQGRPRSRTLAAPAAGMGALMESLRDRLIQRGVTFDFERTARPDEDEIDGGPAAICTSAPAAARLLADAAPEIAAALARIRMVSLLLVTAFFVPRPDDLRGFGILFPRRSGVQALGAIFNADVFVGRSDVRSETWVYGDPDAAGLAPTDADAVRQMSSDREVLTGRAAAPVAAYVTRQPSALPVYDAAVLAARAAMPELPAHLAVTGNYLGRLGVSSLLTGAAEAAMRLHASCAGGAGLPTVTRSADRGTRDSSATDASARGREHATDAARREPVGSRGTRA